MYARLPHPGPCANLRFCAANAAGAGVPARFHVQAAGFPADFYAGVAQLVEHLICNQTVGGSNPFASSTNCGARAAPGRKFEPEVA